MKTEKWNGHEIRFIEVDGKWYAVLKDVCNALDITNPSMVAKRLPDNSLTKADPKQYLGSQSNEQVLMVNEFGIYKTIFQSRKPEAEQFQMWVFEMIAKLREATGLEGFQAFRMLDKEHQKDAMKRLSEISKPQDKLNYIKANTIANKCVSLLHGIRPSAKKEDMTPAMLEEREPVLDDTVELMKAKEKFGLDIHVSQKIYEKYGVM